MERQYEQYRDRPTMASSSSVLEDLKQRSEQVAAEVEEEQRRNVELAAAREAVVAEEAALQNRIDELLSSSPEEFVIRFIQTEGQ